jgi:hypothetical protein
VLTMVKKQREQNGTAQQWQQQMNIELETADRTCSEYYA